MPEAVRASAKSGGYVLVQGGEGKGREAFSITKSWAHAFTFCKDDEMGYDILNTDFMPADGTAEDEAVYPGDLKNCNCFLIDSNYLRSKEELKAMSTAAAKKKNGKKAKKKKV